MPSDVVDRIMEPECQRDFVKAFSRTASLIQPGETLIEMLERVIAAPTLGIARDEVLVECVVTLRDSQAPPRRAPVLNGCHRPDEMS